MNRQSASPRERRSRRGGPDRSPRRTKAAPSGRPPYRNLCRPCGENFANVEVFDAHRVGKHEYVASKERPDGRRCLTHSEMELRGWRKKPRKGWTIPARSARGRRLQSPKLLEASVKPRRTSDNGSEAKGGASS